MLLLRTVFIAAIVLLLSNSQVNAVTVFTANLTGSQETPPNGSTATGSATFILNDAKTALSFTATIFGIDVNGLQTPGITADNLTAAHIHCCQPLGSPTPAPVVWGFFGSPFNDNNPDDSPNPQHVIPFASGVGGTFSGKWDLPEGNNTTLTAQLPGILANLAYINFHTSAFPSGEIRGQILLTPEPTTLCLLGIGLLALGRVLRKHRIRP